jgi:hypothetical protein
LIRADKKVTFQGIDSHKKYDLGTVKNGLLRDSNILNFDGGKNLDLGGGRGRVGGRYLRDNFVGGS